MMNNVQYRDDMVSQKSNFHPKKHGLIITVT